MRKDNIDNNTNNMFFDSRKIFEVSIGNLCKFDFDDDESNQFVINNTTNLDTSEIILEIQYLNGAKASRIVPFDDYIWVKSEQQ